MLACDEVDAVYIPLPNHLHVPWSIKALEAGKHVLCEKPLGLNSGEVVQLQNTAENFTELLVMEAFMYRFHPQFQTDRHASGMLDFGQGMATFQGSTQSHLSQMVKIIGDKGTLEVENPFFSREGIPSRLTLYRNNIEETIVVGEFNHYVCQVDVFCQAALNQFAAPTPLAYAHANMKAIDAIFASASENGWVNIPA